ncbi:hypothetical protein GGF42_008718, partial [Coemansia sp. RSA 2424]
ARPLRRAARRAHRRGHGRASADGRRAAAEWPHRHAPAAARRAQRAAVDQAIL